MTIAQLKQHLNQFPDETLVVTYNSEYGDYHIPEIEQLVVEE